MKELINYLLRKQWILHLVMCFLSDNKKDQVYIARIRAEFAFLGCDTSHLNDEAIKELISKMAKMVEYYGMEAAQIKTAFRVLANFKQLKTK
jgi:hypothetical protein